MYIYINMCINIRCTVPPLSPLPSPHAGTLRAVKSEDKCHEPDDLLILIDAVRNSLTHTHTHTHTHTSSLLLAGARGQCEQ